MYILYALKQQSVKRQSAEILNPTVLSLTRHKLNIDNLSTLGSFL